MAQRPYKPGANFPPRSRMSSSHPRMSPSHAHTARSHSTHREQVYRLPCELNRRDYRFNHYEPDFMCAPPSHLPLHPLICRRHSLVSPLSDPATNPRRLEFNPHKLPPHPTTTHPHARRRYSSHCLSPTWTEPGVLHGNGRAFDNDEIEGASAGTNRSDPFSPRRVMQLATTFYRLKPQPERKAPNQANYYERRTKTNKQLPLFLT